MSKLIRIFAGAALIALSNGCLHSNVDEHWGEAYNAQIEEQTADPAAPANTEPLEGLDPETGLRVADRYYKGQEAQKQRQAPAVIIQGN